MKNAYGLLSAALKSYTPEIKISVKLPQPEKRQTYVPTDNEIKELMDYLKEYDKDMYIACNLATFGTMRRFRFHVLRHYSASIMHAIGVPDVYIMERGGWSSDHTLKNIYRGSMDDFSKKFTDMTNEHFSIMQHEMQQKNKEPSIY